MSAATSASSPVDRVPGCILERQFERAFFVFGLRRGGNHALAEWLKGHFEPGEVLHLNNARPAAITSEVGVLRVDDDTYVRVVPAPEQRVLLVGYENADFLRFPAAHNFRVAHRSDWLVVLRDFPNMAASISRSARERPDFVWRHRLRDFPELWASYARRFLEGRGGVRYVSFNRWFAEPEFRAELADGLRLAGIGRGLNVVSAEGGGSSFDGLAFDGNAQRMAVLQRWPEMLHDELFRFLLLVEPENLRRNAEIFGNFPHTYDEIFEAWRCGGFSSRSEI